MHWSGLLLAAAAGLSLPAKAAPGYYYPERAAKAQASGVVRLDCQVAPTGDLNACKVVSENPMGFGFGQAALRMVADGVATLPADAKLKLKQGGRAVFPIRFSPDQPIVKPPV